MTSYQVAKRIATITNKRMGCPGAAEAWTKAKTSDLGHSGDAAVNMEGCGFEAAYNASMDEKMIDMFPGYFLEPYSGSLLMIYKD